MSAEQIRQRKSYKMFENLLKSIEDGKVEALDFLYAELDRRRAFGSQRASDFAQESLELIKQDKL